jgi:hypothetical protein
LVPCSHSAQQEWGLQQVHGINSNVTEQALLLSGGGKFTHLFTEHWHRRDSVEQCRCKYDKEQTRYRNIQVGVSLDAQCTRRPADAKYMATTQYVPADSLLACACPPPGCESAPNITQDTSQHSKKGGNGRECCVKAGCYLLGVVFLLQLLVGVHQSVERHSHHQIETIATYVVAPEMITKYNSFQRLTFHTKQRLPSKIQTTHSKCTPHTLKHMPHN